MSFYRHIPNALTLGNLLCGCLGILASLDQSLTIAAYFIWSAGVFDFLDGFAARLLKVSSPIGKELDSLADIVSFGVLPSFILYRLIERSTPNEWLPYCAFLIAAFSALRLAKFNVDTNQQSSFIGLPTPANAFFFSSLIFLKEPFQLLTENTASLLTLVALFSFLMVSRIKLFAIKLKNSSWHDNKLPFTFIALSVFLLVIMQAAGIAVVILLYILLSLLFHSKK